MKLPLIGTPFLRSFAGQLSREARDTLFLLGTIAAALLPHVGHLPAWCTALTALILLWRARIAWGGLPLPGRWVLATLIAVFATLTLLTYSRLLGREPSITLLTLLMALKTLELRARRDAFVVFFLGFFLLLAGFFYSQSLLTALWMLLCVWALLSSLVLAQIPSGQPSLALAARHAARSTLLGLPLMVALFLLFPRIGPLWGVPSETVGHTGLSNRLDFGAMSEIANDDSIAMRLRFEGARPADSQLYFRGPVLTHFDGRSWVPEPGLLSRGDGAPHTGGQPIRYQMTLEPLRVAVVPMLEMGGEPPGAQMSVNELTLTRGSDLQWLAPRPVTERLRFTEKAWLNVNYGPTSPTPSLRAALQLPNGLNPRTRAWALALKTSLPQAGTEQLVAAVLEHLRTGDYTYTLAPGRYGETGPNLIDEFWFDRRTGFCEHFAASFVVVMRAMGVPARIVTGFQGADTELQDGDLVVRNSAAHAWTEVWVESRGWVRADPTGAVAPQRILQSLQLHPAPGVFAGALDQVNPALWAALRGDWETINNRWEQIVLNYSHDQQFDLLKSLGWAQPDWLALGQTTAGLIAAIGLAAGLYTRWQARPHDAWSRQRARIVAVLKRCGLPATESQGPRHWAQLAEARFGDRAAPLIRLLLALEASRYSGAASNDTPTWRERRRWLATFKAAAFMLRSR